jgi:hypothetical protein
MNVSSMELGVLIIINNNKNNKNNKNNNNNNLGSAMHRTTSDDIKCGMWNVEWCINVKNNDRLYESWNGSTGMEKKECSGIAC